MLLTVTCAMLIPTFYYLSVILLTEDHLNVIPAVIGHGLGATATMFYVSRRGRPTTTG